VTHQHLLLVTLVDVLETLLNRLGRRANAANGEKDVVTQKVRGQSLNLPADKTKEAGKTTRKFEL
jgi:hypothetical protein